MENNTQELTNDFSDHETVYLLREKNDGGLVPAGKQAADSAAPKTPTTGSFLTFFNITKCFVGAASFELPWAFKEAGLLGGTIGLLVLALFSYYTLIILAKCGHFTATIFSSKTHLSLAVGGKTTTDGHNSAAVVGTTRITYPDIGRTCFGRIGAFFAWFGIVAMTVGVCGSYLVFMGSALKHMLSQYSPFFHTTVACTALVLPLVIGLSWLRSMRLLAPTSMLGIMALIFSLVVTIVDGARNESLSVEEDDLVHVGTYPLFLGNAAFLYLIHSVVLPTEQSMKDRSKYKLCLLASIIFVTVLNLGFSIICLMFWKEHTAQNIIDNLSHGVVTTLVRIFLSIDLLFTFALFLFPVSEALEHNFFNPSLFGKSWKEEMKRNALRVLLVVATAGVALSIPFFSLLTGLSGVFGNNMLGFLLPTLLYIFLSHRFGYWDCLLTSGEEYTTIDEVVVINSNDFFNDETKGKKRRKPTLRRLFVGRNKAQAWLRLGELLLCITIFLLGLAMMGLGIQAFIHEIIKEYS
ncbi:Transmembrane amino acid transporter protein [Balamuthia mandrillaris]